MTRTGVVCAGVGEGRGKTTRSKQEVPFPITSTYIVSVVDCEGLSSDISPDKIH